jgi:CRISPR type I-E-associated protein CasB/Cse2
MKQDSIARFISRLEALGDIPELKNPDRRALAALRRSLATWPKLPPEAVRVVAPFLPEHATGWRETVYYLIGGLFALYPCPSSQEKYGLSLGKALHLAQKGDEGLGPERRLLALLGCNSEDLPNHLRHAVSYLRAREVPIDYRQLMWHLLQWDKIESNVQRRWGRDFWSGTLEENQQEFAESVIEENRHVH